MKYPDHVIQSFQLQGLACSTNTTAARHSCSMHSTSSPRQPQSTTWNWKSSKGSLPFMVLSEDNLRAKDKSRPLNSSLGFQVIPVKGWTLNGWDPILKSEGTSVWAVTQLVSTEIPRLSARPAVNVTPGVFAFYRKRQSHIRERNWEQGFICSLRKQATEYEPNRGKERRLWLPWNRCCPAECDPCRLSKIFDGY